MRFSLRGPCFPGSKTNSWQHSLTISFSSHSRYFRKPIIRLRDPAGLSVHYQFPLVPVQWYCLSQAGSQWATETNLDRTLYSDSCHSYGCGSSWHYTMDQLHPGQESGSHRHWCQMDCLWTANPLKVRFPGAWGSSSACLSTSPGVMFYIMDVKTGLWSKPHSPQACWTMRKTDTGKALIS